MIRTNDHGRWLTVPEAAEAFGVKPGTIYAWVTRYGLASHPVGGLMYLSEDELAVCEKKRRDTPQYTNRGVPR